MSLRTIDAGKIEDAVAQLCIRANTVLAPDIDRALAKALESEDSQAARWSLETCRENIRVAESEAVAVCQDTGVAVVFVEIGQNTHVEGGLRDAIDEGVRRGYREGYLRRSVVSDPIKRENTGDNTPAVIHFDIVPGDGLEITVAPKGFGSENMSRLWMLTPSEGVDGIVRAVVETARLAGANPCPPVILGVGIGGTAESCMLAAKKALLREVGSAHPDKIYAELEARMLAEVNALGIGPQGFGGRTTALAVHINALPTHIAGLPVAVNVGCHVTRHASARL